MGGVCRGARALYSTDGLTARIGGGVDLDVLPARMDWAADLDAIL
jgi:hypothetical protein